MKNRLRLEIALPILILAILLLHPISSQATTIGIIGDFPASDIKMFLPLARYLSKELRTEGVTEGKVLVAQDINELAGFLRQGKIDIYIVSYARALALNRLVGGSLLLRRWKKGVAEYHGVIFVRQDSNINKLADLRGKVVAFDEPLSAVGHMLPKMMLMKMGLKPVAGTTTPHGNSVGYLFGERDENTMHWVLNGKVAAGAMDNQRFGQEARARIIELKVLEKTPSIPRSIVGARTDLPARRIRSIKEILTGMDLWEEGRQILSDLEHSTKFDLLTEQNLELASKLKKLIEAELNLR